MAYDNTYPYVYPILYYTTTRRFIKTETGQNRKILTSTAQNRVMTSAAGQNRTILTSTSSGIYGE